MEIDNVNTGVEDILVDTQPLSMVTYHQVDTEIGLSVFMI